MLFFDVNKEENAEQGKPRQWSKTPWRTPWRRQCRLSEREVGSSTKVDQFLGFHREKQEVCHLQGCLRRGVSWGETPEEATAHLQGTSRFATVRPQSYPGAVTVRPSDGSLEWLPTTCGQGGLRLRHGGETPSGFQKGLFSEGKMSHPERGSLVERLKQVEEG